MLKYLIPIVALVLTIACQKKNNNSSQSSPLANLSKPTLDISGSWQSKCMKGYKRSQNTHYEFSSGRFQISISQFSDEGCQSIIQETLMKGTYHIGKGSSDNSLSGNNETFPIDFNISQRIISLPGKDEAYTGQCGILEGGCDVNEGIYTIINLNKKSLRFGEQQPKTNLSGATPDLRHIFLSDKSIDLQD